MLNSIIKSITRSSSQQDERDRSPIQSPVRPGDSEEDGFLLVGESASERTTVKTSEFRGDMDAPPEYNKAVQIPGASDCLPSYVEYCRSASQTESNMDLSVNKNSSSVHVNPVSDVPLVLDPELQLVFDILKETSWSQNISPPRLNIAEFTYDFVLEESVLSEMTLAV